MSRLAGICVAVLVLGLAAGAEAASAKRDKAAPPAKDPPPAVEAAPEKELGPEEVVATLHDSLLEVMKEADTLGVSGRFDRLRPRIESVYDLGRMVQASAGAFWRSATDDQRRRLFETFRRLSIGTYAAQFRGYSGEEFVVAGERQGPQGTLLVDTRIERQAKPPVALTYVLQRTEKGWRIVDVLLDRSISELAVRRSEYRRILENGGMDTLIATLETKVEQLLSGTAEPPGEERR